MYSDKGKSGKNTADREEFNEMIRCITNGNKDGVEYVYVFKLSRFGRNTADAIYHVKLMEDYGVKLFAVSDEIDSGGPSGKLLIPIMAAVAEIERENILAQTMAGRRKKVSLGAWNGGQSPFGYELKDGELLIDEEEAEIVRIIYDLYLNSRKGMAGIAKWLNIHGYRKKIRGNGKYDTFTAHFIKLILDNPVYCGKISYGRRTNEKIEGTRNQYHKVKQTEVGATISDARALVTYFLENADKILSEEDRRDVVHDFVKEIQIYQTKSADGWIKEITFNFPVRLDGEVDRSFRQLRTTDETVCLLSRKK